MKTPSSHGRDPVCQAIEDLLHDLEVDGRGPLHTTSNDGSVRLGFEGIRVEAPTYDIALVRLANAMIDDPKYFEEIREVLHRSMETAR
jgi:hypothetical protein